MPNFENWVSFYKANRGLLNVGEVLRLDFPDPTILTYGVIAPDRSTAIYTVASVGLSAVILPGRLRFRAWIRPAVPHPADHGRTSASGAQPAALVGRGEGGIRSVRGAAHYRLGLPADGGPGLILSGAALASAGVMAAGIHPEQAILYRADALD